MVYSVLANVDYEEWSYHLHGAADHVKYDFYPSTWHIPCEYLHPWAVLSPVTLKNVQNGCICGEFEVWAMWFRRYSLRMFDSEVSFYYRNHPSTVRLAGQTNKMSAHPFAFNRKLCLSYLDVISRKRMKPQRSVLTPARYFLMLWWSP